MTSTTELQTADDETIRAALAEACIPALMNAMVHLSGSPDLIRGDIRPLANILADPQAGITEAQQETVREEAFRLIKAYQKADGRLSSLPDEGLVQEMMNFITGLSIDEDYVPFLRSELSLNDQASFEMPDFSDVPEQRLEDFSVLVIGAGMSGILTAIKLKEAGIDYKVVEKNAEVGGTWYENTYPGCRVDSPNHTYSYSFAPKDWPQYYSSQPVLLDYFRSVADEFGVRDSIRFETEVVSAVYDGEKNQWQVTVRTPGGDLEEMSANAVISAVGQLNRPRLPDIPGRDSFEGPSFHSGRWEHEHDLCGKKVAVIGTGASAFQFVPVIAEEAADVTIFQRTPPWVSPREEYHREIPEGKHWLLNNLPYYAEWFRFFMFWRTSEGMLPAARRDPAWNESGSISEANLMIRNMLTESARSIVGDDEELMRSIIPDYAPAGKRMLVDNGTWYRALKQEGVNLVTDPVREITATGVITESGDQYDADVLVFATGFQASRFLTPMEVTGINGATLHGEWREDPRAYMGMTIPDFPNFFVIYGPNTNLVVNGSIIFFSECEVRYIMGCLSLLLHGEYQAMSPDHVVHDEYNTRIDAGNLTMSWGSEDVSSWYKNDSGRVTQNWPFTLREFWEQTKGPDPADFEFL